MSRDHSRPQNCTELGNAKRLVARHGKDLRHVSGLGWLCWDGRRWLRDQTGEVHRRAKETVVSILAEAMAAPDTERTLLAKHATNSERAGAIRAMIELASTEAEIVAELGDFDRDPALLTVMNGTIDLRTGELRPHRREDLITKLAPVEYDPRAVAPRFQRFLCEIMADDLEKVAFLQRAIGYSLSGETSEQCLFFCYGNGSNGKGALVRTLEALLGDHFRKTPFATFLERRNEGVREDVADLQGARLVSAEETRGSGGRLDEGQVKTLTGQDTISARFLHRDRFTFRPMFKLWLAANRKPRISGTDEGMWRRMKLIPFTVHIATPDLTLEHTIQGPELPGVTWTAAT